MWFITEDEMLFNTTTQVVIELKHHENRDFWVQMGEHILFHGTVEKCADFVYSIAGYVGAVNPLPREITIPADYKNIIKRN